MCAVPCQSAFSVHWVNVNILSSFFLPLRNSFCNSTKLFFTATLSPNLLTCTQIPYTMRMSCIICDVVICSSLYIKPISLDLCSFGTCPPSNTKLPLTRSRFVGLMFLQVLYDGTYAFVWVTSALLYLFVALFVLHPPAPIGSRLPSWFRNLALFVGLRGSSSANISQLFFSYNATAHALQPLFKAA